MALRDLYDVDEARRRTEEALSQRGWAGFEMPRLNSLVDLLFNELVAGDYGKAQSLMPSVWDEVSAGRAWQGWNLAGKMIVAQAEIELYTGQQEAALSSAGRAVEQARSAERRKYEAVAQRILGEALLAEGRPAEAAGELRSAAELADALGSPPGRWQSYAALGRALYAVGDEGAERALRESERVIRAVAESLAPERATGFLSAPPIQEALAAATGHI
jgi:tetratricopeptide (TPR) repeat protein